MTWSPVFGPVPHFAWPYGQLHHFSDAAREAVREVGHISSASVVRGAHKPAGNMAPDQVLYLRRDQVWALNPAEHVLYFCARGGNRKYRVSEFVWPEAEPRAARRYKASQPSAARAKSSSTGTRTPKAIPRIT